MLFGSCTICLNVFRIGYDVSHSHCKSQLELVFPAIEIIFIGFQVTDLCHLHATSDMLCPPRPHAHTSLSVPQTAIGNTSLCPSV